MWMKGMEVDRRPPHAALLVGPDYQAEQADDERNEAQGGQTHEHAVNGIHGLRLLTSDGSTERQDGTVRLIKSDRK
jgi:hypothetical protein